MTSRLRSIKEEIPMFPSALIDLHCDTLADWKYANTGNPDTLDDPERVLSLSAMPEGVNWAQFYAVFIPDEEQARPLWTTLRKTV